MDCNNADAKFALNTSFREHPKPTHITINTILYLRADNVCVVMLQKPCLGANIRMGCKEIVDVSALASLSEAT